MPSSVGLRTIVSLGSVACWVMLVAASGAAPPATATGTIRAECERFRLDLISGGSMREVVGEKGCAAVPAGTYYVLHSDTEFTDKVGRVWRVRNGMVGAPIVVRAGQTTRLELGAPLETKLRLRIEEGKLIAEAQFWGPMGDKCEGVVVGGGALPPPRVKIVDEAGTVLARPEGTYCCKFTASIIWPLPPDAPRRLQVVPEVSLGPVPVWSEGSPTIDPAGD